MVVRELNNSGLTNCKPGWNSSARMQQSQDATENQHGKAEQQVQSSNVFVVGRINPALPARRGMVVVGMGVIVVV